MRDSRIKPGDIIRPNEHFSWKHDFQIVTWDGKPTKSHLFVVTEGGTGVAEYPSGKPVYGCSWLGMYSKEDLKKIQWAECVFSPVSKFEVDAFTAIFEAEQCSK